MAKAPKTKPTDVSVDDFIAGVMPEARREDAQALCAFMARVTGEPPTLWGPTIIGFGVRHYRTADGREHPMLGVGFSPRQPALVLYVTGPAEDDPLAARLGKFTHGKSCIYVKRLADIDLTVLEAMIHRALSRTAA